MPAMTETEKEEDAKIRVVWAEFKVALKAKDIKKVLEYMSDEVKETYEYNLDLLKDHFEELPSILQGNLELDNFYDDIMANYYIWSEYEGEKTILLCVLERTKTVSGKLGFFNDENIGALS